MFRRTGRGRRASGLLLAALLVTAGGAPSALAQDTPQDRQDGASKARPPRPLNYVAPAHPPEAEKQGLEGTVILELTIDKAGKVTKATVVGPAGHGFDEAALEAANKLEFSPALRADGTPTAAKILYKYTFTLTTVAPDRDAEPKPAAMAPHIRGRVLTSEGDAPIAGATVILRGGGGAQQTVTVDESGEFRFDDLAPGRYRITISAPGFEGLSLDEEVRAGEATEVKYRLLTQGDGLEVTVRGARPPREVVRRTLEREEIRRIPGTNGDALRSLQNLPGVARPPAIAGVLLVRGSGPGDSQTFIDGTYVPLIYHFGGLSSVVPTEVLEKIDFYPGNFSTEYGRVMGGIVDVSLRNPKDDGRYHGLAQLDLIDVRAILEGPIPFLDGWTFLAGGRRSYFDAWLGPTLEAAGAGVTQLPVYYDYQFMVATNPSPASNFRLGFFGSDDALELVVPPQAQEPAFSGNVGLHTAFQRLQAIYQHDLEDTKVRAVAALGRDILDFGVGAAYLRIGLDTLSWRAEVSQRLGKGVTLNAGMDTQMGIYDVAMRFPAPPRPGEPPNAPFSTRAFIEESFKGEYFFPAAYLEMVLSPHPRAKLVPGVRLDYQNLNGRFDASPRVNGRFDIVQGFPRTTAKGGVGLFHQPPQFPQMVEPIGNPNLTSNRAVHYALGMEQEITRNIEASVEGFYKDLDRRVVPRAVENSPLSTYDNEGRGYAFGGEFLLKYKPQQNGRFFGWAAYTLSRSARRDAPDEPERLVPFDQTHILTVLGSYQLGKGWEFGARFRLVSGNLITPNVCDPESGGCDPTRTNALFHAPSGVYTPIPLTAAYSERLPMFHQLDLRVEKTWPFKAWKLSMYLDVQNVYANANAEAVTYDYNYVSRQYVSGIPILPSIGLRGEF